MTSCKQQKIKQHQSSFNFWRNSKGKAKQIQLLVLTKLCWMSSQHGGSQRARGHREWESPHLKRRPRRLWAGGGGVCVVVCGGSVGLSPREHVSSSFHLKEKPLTLDCLEAHWRADSQGCDRLWPTVVPFGKVLWGCWSHKNKVFYGVCGWITVLYPHTCFSFAKGFHPLFGLFYSIGLGLNLCCFSKALALLSKMGK